MKHYVLIFQEITGQWVSVYHVSVVRRRSYVAALQDAKSCLIVGRCEGRYLGKRCVVYCTDDHAMWELVLVNGLVEVYC